MFKYFKYARYLVAVCCIAAIGILSAPAGHTAAQSASTTLTVVERAETDTITDTGAKGDSVGDILTFSNAVYDKDNKTQVGSDNGYCFRTVAGIAWECAWTLTLKDGQIMVQGPFYDQEDSVLAITGGTGAYNTVRGEMKLHARDEKGSAYDFTYTFVK